MKPLRLPLDVADPAAERSHRRWKLVRNGLLGLAIAVPVANAAWQSPDKWPYLLGFAAVYVPLALGAGYRYYQSMVRARARDAQLVLYLDRLVIHPRPGADALTLPLSAETALHLAYHRAPKLQAQEVVPHNTQALRRAWLRGELGQRAWRHAPGRATLTLRRSQHRNTYPLLVPTWAAWQHLKACAQAWQQAGMLVEIEKAPRKKGANLAA